MPEPAKAVSLGAKTVKGPVPDRVTSSPAFTTADLSRVKLPLVETMLVMVEAAGVAGVLLFLQAVKIKPENSSRAAARRVFSENELRIH